MGETRAIGDFDTLDITIDQIGFEACWSQGEYCIYKIGFFSLIKVSLLRTYDS